MSHKPVAYWDYIKIEELLSLQAGLDKDDQLLANDEVMFIVVHQIEELWMKLVLRELIAARDLFAGRAVPEQSLAAAVRGIERMTLLMRHAAQHFDVMETLTTRDYLAFRDKLSPASGFQSAQMREIEILSGLPDSDRIPLGHERGYMEMLRDADGNPSSASRRVEARLSDKPTLLEATRQWLHRTPIQGSTPGDPADDDRVRDFLDSYCAAQARASEGAMARALDMVRTEADRVRLRERYSQEIAGARAFLFAEELPEPERAFTARVRAALVFIESYRELPLLAWPRAILDSLVSYEQAFVIFRQRHARMVERVIGRRTGTGGSAGVEYLDQTALRYRIFRDIWAVRTILVQETLLPPLANPGFYDFRQHGPGEAPHT